MSNSDAQKRHMRPLAVVLFVICLIYTLGLFTFFHACGPKEDGTFMTCHWAEMALRGTALVMLIQSAFILSHEILSVSACGHEALASRFPDLSAAGAVLVPPAVFSAVLPGNVIPLCMMESMRCRSIMRPYTLLSNLLIILIAAAALKQKKH